METADGWVAAETESVFDQIAFLNYLKNLRGLRQLRKVVYPSQGALFLCRLTIAAVVEV